MQREYWKRAFEGSGFKEGSVLDIITAHSLDKILSDYTEFTAEELEEMLEMIWQVAQDPATRPTLRRALLSVLENVMADSQTPANVTASVTGLILTDLYQNEQSEKIVRDPTHPVIEENVKLLMELVYRRPVHEMSDLVAPLLPFILTYAKAGRLRDLARGNLEYLVLEGVFSPGGPLETLADEVNNSLEAFKASSDPATQQFANRVLSSDVWRQTLELRELRVGVVGTAFGDYTNNDNTSDRGNLRYNLENIANIFDRYPTDGVMKVGLDATLPSHKVRELHRLRFFHLYFDPASFSGNQLDQFLTGQFDEPLKNLLEQVKAEGPKEIRGHFWKDHFTAQKTIILSPDITHLGEVEQVLTHFHRLIQEKQMGDEIQLTLAVRSDASEIELQALRAFLENLPAHQRPHLLIQGVDRGQVRNRKDGDMPTAMFSRAYRMFQDLGTEVYLYLPNRAFSRTAIDELNRAIQSGPLKGIACVIQSSRDIHQRADERAAWENFVTQSYMMPERDVIISGFNFSKVFGNLSGISLYAVSAMFGFILWNGALTLVRQIWNWANRRGVWRFRGPLHLRGGGPRFPQAPFYRLEADLAYLQRLIAQFQREYKVWQRFSAISVDSSRTPTALNRLTSQSHEIVTTIAEIYSENHSLDSVNALLATHPALWTQAIQHLQTAETRTDLSPQQQAEEIQLRVNQLASAVQYVKRQLDFQLNPHRERAQDLNFTEIRSHLSTPQTHGWFTFSWAAFIGAAVPFMVVVFGELFLKKLTLGHFFVWLETHAPILVLPFKVLHLTAVHPWFAFIVAITVALTALFWPFIARAVFVARRMADFHLRASTREVGFYTQEERDDHERRASRTQNIFGYIEHLGINWGSYPLEDALRESMDGQIQVRRQLEREMRRLKRVLSSLQEDRLFPDISVTEKKNHRAQVNQFFTGAEQELEFFRQSIDSEDRHWEDVEVNRLRDRIVNPLHFDHEGIVIRSLIHADGVRLEALVANLQTLIDQWDNRLIHQAEIRLEEQQRGIGVPYTYGVGSRYAAERELRLEERIGQALAQLTGMSVNEIDFKSIRLRYNSERGQGMIYDVITGRGHYVVEMVRRTAPYYFTSHMDGTGEPFAQGEFLQIYRVPNLLSRVRSALSSRSLQPSIGEPVGVWLDMGIINPRYHQYENPNEQSVAHAERQAQFLAHLPDFLESLVAQTQLTGQFDRFLVNLVDVEADNVLPGAVDAVPFWTHFQRQMQRYEGRFQRNIHLLNRLPSARHPYQILVGDQESARTLGLAELYQIQRRVEVAMHRQVREEADPEDLSFENTPPDLYDEIFGPPGVERRDAWISRIQRLIRAFASRQFWIRGNIRNLGRASEPFFYSTEKGLNANVLIVGIGLVVLCFAFIVSLAAAVLYGAGLLLHIASIQNVDLNFWSNLSSLMIDLTTPFRPFFSLDVLTHLPTAWTSKQQMAAAMVTLVLGLMGLMLRHYSIAVRINAWRYIQRQIDRVEYDQYVRSERVSEQQWILDHSQPDEQEAVRRRIQHLNNESALAAEELRVLRERRNQIEEQLERHTNFMAKDPATDIRRWPTRNMNNWRWSFAVLFSGFLMLGLSGGQWFIKGLFWLALIVSAVAFYLNNEKGTPHRIRRMHWEDAHRQMDELLPLVINLWMSHHPDEDLPESIASMTEEYHVAADRVNNYLTDRRIDKTHQKFKTVLNELGYRPLFTAVPLTDLREVGSGGAPRPTFTAEEHGQISAALARLDEAILQSKHFSLARLTGHVEPNNWVRSRPGELNTEINVMQSRGAQWTNDQGTGIRERMKHLIARTVWSRHPNGDLPQNIQSALSAFERTMHQIDRRMTHRRIDKAYRQLIVLIEQTGYSSEMSRTTGYTHAEWTAITEAIQALNEQILGLRSRQAESYLNRFAFNEGVASLRKKLFMVMAVISFFLFINFGLNFAHMNDLQSGKDAILFLKNSAHHLLTLLGLLFGSVLLMKGFTSRYSRGTQIGFFVLGASLFSAMASLDLFSHLMQGMNPLFFSGALLFSFRAVKEGLVKAGWRKIAPNVVFFAGCMISGISLSGWMPALSWTSGVLPTTLMVLLGGAFYVKFVIMTLKGQGIQKGYKPLALATLALLSIGSVTPLFVEFLGTLLNINQANMLHGGALAGFYTALLMWGLAATFIPLIFTRAGRAYVAAIGITLVGAGAAVYQIASWLNFVDGSFFASPWIKWGLAGVLLIWAVPAMIAKMTSSHSNLEWTAVKSRFAIYMGITILLSAILSLFIFTNTTFLHSASGNPLFQYFFNIGFVLTVHTPVKVFTDWVMTRLISFESAPRDANIDPDQLDRGLDDEHRFAFFWTLFLNSVEGYFDMFQKNMKDNIETNRDRLFYPITNQEFLGSHDDLYIVPLDEEWAGTPRANTQTERNEFLRQCWIRDVQRARHADQAASTPEQLSHEREDYFYTHAVYSLNGQLYKVKRNNIIYSFASGEKFWTASKEADFFKQSPARQEELTIDNRQRSVNFTQLFMESYRRYQGEGRGDAFFNMTFRVLGHDFKRRGERRLDKVEYIKPSSLFIQELIKVNELLEEYPEIEINVYHKALAPGEWEYIEIDRKAGKFNDIFRLEEGHLFSTPIGIRKSDHERADRELHGSHELTYQPSVGGATGRTTVDVVVGNTGIRRLLGLEEPMAGSGAAHAPPVANVFDFERDGLYLDRAALHTIGVDYTTDYVPNPTDAAHPTPALGYTYLADENHRAIWTTAVQDAEVRLDPDAALKLSAARAHPENRRFAIFQYALDTHNEGASLNAFLDHMARFFLGYTVMASQIAGEQGAFFGKAPINQIQYRRNLLVEVDLESGICIKPATHEVMGKINEQERTMLAGLNTLQYRLSDLEGALKTYFPVLGDREYVVRNLMGELRDMFRVRHHRIPRDIDEYMETAWEELERQLHGRESRLRLARGILIHQGVPTAEINRRIEELSNDENINALRSFTHESLISLIEDIRTIWNEERRPVATMQFLLLSPNGKFLSHDTVETAHAVPLIFFDIYARETGPISLSSNLGRFARWWNGDKRGKDVWSPTQASELHPFVRVLNKMLPKEIWEVGLVRVGGWWQQGVFFSWLTAGFFGIATASLAINSVKVGLVTLIVVMYFIVGIVKFGSPLAGFERQTRFRSKLAYGFYSITVGWFEFFITTLLLNIIPTVLIRVMYSSAKGDIKLKIVGEDRGKPWNPAIMDDKAQTLPGAAKSTWIGTFLAFFLFGAIGINSGFASNAFVFALLAAPQALALAVSYVLHYSTSLPTQRARMITARVLKIGLFFGFPLGVFLYLKAPTSINNLLILFLDHSHPFVWHDGWTQIALIALQFLSLAGSGVMGWFGGKMIYQGRVDEIKGDAFSDMRRAVYNSNPRRYSLPTKVFYTFVGIGVNLGAFALANLSIGALFGGLLVTIQLIALSGYLASLSVNRATHESLTPAEQRLSTIGNWLFPVPESVPSTSTVERWKSGDNRLRLDTIRRLYLLWLFQTEAEGDVRARLVGDVPQWDFANRHHGLRGDFETIDNARNAAHFDSHLAQTADGLIGYLRRTDTNPEQINQSLNEVHVLARALWETLGERRTELAARVANPREYVTRNVFSETAGVRHDGWIPKVLVLFAGAALIVMASRLGPDWIHWPVKWVGDYVRHDFIKYLGILLVSTSSFLLRPIHLAFHAFAPTLDWRSRTLEFGRPRPQDAVQLRELAADHSRHLVFDDQFIDLLFGVEESDYVDLEAVRLRATGGTPAPTTTDRLRNISLALLVIGVMSAFFISLAIALMAITLIRIAIYLIQLANRTMRELIRRFPRRGPPPAGPAPSGPASTTTSTAGATPDLFSQTPLASGLFDLLGWMKRHPRAVHPDMNYEALMASVNEQLAGQLNDAIEQATQGRVQNLKQLSSLNGIPVRLSNRQLLRLEKQIDTQGVLTKAKISNSVRALILRRMLALQKLQTLFTVLSHQDEARPESAAILKMLLTSNVRVVRHASRAAAFDPATKTIIVDESIVSLEAILKSRNDQKNAMRRALEVYAASEFFHESLEASIHQHQGMLASLGWTEAHLDHVKETSIVTRQLRFLLDRLSAEERHALVDYFKDSKHTRFDVSKMQF
jgi:hypothetical protein